MAPSLSSPILLSQGTERDLFHSLSGVSTSLTVLYICRRARAAFAAFSERELPQLKLDRPGLKQSQYKDALWKQWQKSNENPFNRVAA